jgi:F0F1-type ATP synthase membrane subunit b/b'
VLTEATRTTWARDSWKRAFRARQAQLARELTAADRLAESAARLDSSHARLNESQRRLEQGQRRVSREAPSTT